MKCMLSSKRYKVLLLYYQKKVLKIILLGENINFFYLEKDIKIVLSGKRCKSCIF